ncbi:MAG: wall-associated protein [Candidatus Brocadia sinica]|nr:MAG: wall-associated protein [Candidatus Brocadia sinica]
MGNVIKEINGRGMATEFVVNELNQQVKIIHAAAVPKQKGKKKPSLKAFQYATNIEYDYNDTVVKKEIENKDSNNGSLAGEFVEHIYAYDILDRLVKETQEVSEAETLTTEYRYDANENRVKIIFPEGNYQETIYDERDLVYRTTNICGCSGGSPNTTHNYDQNGNLIETIDGEDNNGDGKNDSALYAYDGFKQGHQNHGSYRKCH